MLIVLCSPHAILRNGSPDPQVVEVLKRTRQAGNPVAIISNNSEPHWFQNSFTNSQVQFIQKRGRQNGEIISRNAQRLSLQPFDCLVLAATGDDVRMGKNGKGVLIAAGWSADPLVNAIGIRVDNPTQLEEVIQLSSQWKGSWWYSANGQQYSVRALANLSTIFVNNDQVAFAKALKGLVKAGGPKLTALLAITARSLLTDEIADSAKMWAVYPSSSSSNDDTEILSDFTHRLRTTVSKVRFAEKNEPLFLRHTATRKRSASSSAVDRTDPTQQLMSIHLNPHYKRKLTNRHVIVVDDCTTYGVSFGVAAALLRAAGAKGMTGVALGKFGNQLREYDINVSGDPFAPLSANDFSCKSNYMMTGTQSTQAQQALLQLLK